MKDTRWSLQHLVLAMFSPALALYVAIRSRSTSFIVFAGTLFMAFVGSTFIYAEGSDGHSHLMDVYRSYLDMSLVAFFEDLGSLLLLQPTDNATDVYKHIISYLAGGVFGVPELIHVFGGLLLGYFFTKSVLLVLEEKPQGKLGILLIGFIGFFLINRSISALNSLRMWTAMWVFFYGALAYMKKGNLKFLFTVGLSFLIHFSYLLFVIPIVAAVLLEKRKLIVLGLFVASFFINVGYNQISSLVGSTGLYEDKADSVVIDEAEKERRTQQREEKGGSVNFYKALGPYVFKSFSTILLALTLAFVYIKGKNPIYLNFLIASALLLLALSNLASVASQAVNGRGYTIASIFLIAATIVVISLKNKLFKSGELPMSYQLSFTVFLLSTVPYVLFQLSYALNTCSIFIFSMPLASWILGGDDFSIKDFIAFDF